MSNSEEIQTETLESTKDPESNQDPETQPPHPSLTIYRNLSYSILKYLEDEIVGDKEIPELGPCTECTNNILSLPIKAITILSCGHIFHRSCIEKQLLYIKPSICPYPDCGKNVDVIVDPNSNRRGSQASQSSGTSAISNLIGEKFVLNSPVILEDPMEGVEALSTAQGKRTSDFPESTRQSSSKKQKTSTDDGESPTLKRLIKELKTPSSASTDTQPPIANPGSLTELYEAIITAEDKNRDTNRVVITRYYSFGEEIEKIFDGFKSRYRDRKAQRLLFKEVKKQLPGDLSKNAIEKRIERGRKVYELFSDIGYDKIQLIKTFSASQIYKLSWEVIDAIEAEFE
jgi:hypothetical protein